MLRVAFFFFLSATSPLPSRRLCRRRGWASGGPDRRPSHSACGATSWIVPISAWASGRRSFVISTGLVGRIGPPLSLPKAGEPVPGGHQRDRMPRMPYPRRPVLEVLPQFVSTNVVRQTPSQRAALVAFVAAEYQAGRSLRQLAELTGRTQTAIRRALDEAGVPRRGRGAPVISSRRGGQP